MRRAVKLSELRQASPELRGAALAGIIAEARAPANGGMEALEAEIAGYEKRFALDSALLPEELSSGRLKETEDLLHWLMLIRIRERVESDRSG